MYFYSTLLDACRFRIFISSWWIKLFSLSSGILYSIKAFFPLKSILSHKTYIISRFLLVFICLAYLLFLDLLTLNLSMLYILAVFHKLYLDGFFFLDSEFMHQHLLEDV